MTHYNCDFSDDGKFLESKPKGDLETLPLKSVITWDIGTPAEGLELKRQIRAFKRIFLRIGQVIPVKFRHIDHTEAEIEINVSNDDGYFTNRPNALARAYVGTTSQALDILFNPSYFWRLNRESGNNQYDLEIVGLHELLHVLGLSHSTINDSVMFPNYQGIYDMNEDDISKLSFWGVALGFRLFSILL